MGDVCSCGGEGTETKLSQAIQDINIPSSYPRKGRRRSVWNGLKGVIDYESLYPAGDSEDDFDDHLCDFVIGVLHSPRQVTWEIPKGVSYEKVQIVFQDCGDVVDSDLILHQAVAVFGEAE